MAYYISATLTADLFAESRYAYNHMQDGIFLGRGSDIRSVSEHLDVNINDVAPTVLSLAGVKLDEEFDGVPVETVLKDVEIPETRTYETVNRVASKDDQTAVEARLEDLGYIG
jgi:predicted AlkP superfamily phosphohydrolase/phosphomutase